MKLILLFLLQLLVFYKKNYAVAFFADIINIIIIFARSAAIAVRAKGRLLPSYPSYKKRGGGWIKPGLEEAKSTLLK